LFVPPPLSLPPRVCYFNGSFIIITDSVTLVDSPAPAAGLLPQGGVESVNFLYFVVIYGSFGSLSVARNRFAGISM
jgi:hypothetical protein